MKTIDIKQPNDNDEEISKILLSSGMSRPVARTLAFLQKVDTATSIDLERVTGLRKPEGKHSYERINPA